LRHTKTTAEILYENMEVVRNLKCYKTVVRKTPRSGNNQQQGFYSNSVQDFGHPFSLKKKKTWNLEEKMRKEHRLSSAITDSKPIILSAVHILSHSVKKMYGCMSNTSNTQHCNLRSHITKQSLETIRFYNKHITSNLQ